MRNILAKSMFIAGLVSSSYSAETNPDDSLSEFNKGQKSPITYGATSITDLVAKFKAEEEKHLIYMSNVRSEISTLQRKIEQHELYLSKITSMDLTEGLNYPSSIIGMFGKFTGLEKLNLTRNTEVSDAALKHVSTIIELNLTENPMITDQGIAELKNLISLDLTKNNNITDKALGTLDHLLFLNLTDNNRISEDVINILRKKNPAIVVVGR